MKKLEQNIDLSFNYTKADFGDDFLWGVASSAFQTEGHHDKFGRGASGSTLEINYDRLSN